MTTCDINYLKSKEWQHYLIVLLNQARKADKRLEEENEGRRPREPWSRDYSRILYSTSFRRLQGKMQLFGVDPEHFFRNRLTHSLEVSEIARSIAIRTCQYQRDELQVVQAAALAHDIGNPPFGHCGEAVLNEISKDFGGFEGNAQTLRILMQLEKKNPESMGLNLTLRSLLAVTKYFVKREPGPKKKFIYDHNYEKLDGEIDKHQITPRTIDVQVIDLADEIAYAAHDLEDALSMRLFSIDEFLFEFKCWLKNEKRDDFTYDKLCHIVSVAREFAEQGKNFNSSEEYHFLLRKELTGLLVGSLIADIDLVEPTQDDKCRNGSKQELELGFHELGELAKGLKKVTFGCINRTNKVQLYEKRAELIIRDLFEILTNDKFNKDCALLPPEYRPQQRDGYCDPRRLVIDYIAGMMDTFAIALHKKFMGEKPLFTTDSAGLWK
ncbi:MAG: dNTP triphosphohydrolase [Deltaproteobacteria bacterium]|nr:dNTP triphosphohydrolase [Deltaproteobacteria bacterium]